MACDFVLDSDEHGEFCTIPLGGKLNLVSTISVDKFQDISRFNWRPWAPPHSKTRYAIRNDGKTTVKMHRQILGLKNEVLVDHKDGNGLNNRDYNLRVATSAQNQWNRIPAGNGSSQYKGVAWHKRDKVWQAQLMYLGKMVWLGNFKPEVINNIDVGEIAAAKAYDKAALKYFGTFAYLNFPEKTMTVYKISKKDEKNALKLIKECKGECVNETALILGTKTVKELEIMCKYLGCNISQLAGKIVGGVLG